jgi:hypothetical protein
MLKQVTYNDTDGGNDDAEFDDELQSNGRQQKGENVQPTWAKLSNQRYSTSTRACLTAVTKTRMLHSAHADVIS